MMSKFSKFFPTAKLANIIMLILCLFECFSFYETGFERGYQIAMEQKAAEHYSQKEH